MSAGVIDVHVRGDRTHWPGSPRSKMTGPFTPAAPRWMCISVAPTTLCTHVTANVDAGLIELPEAAAAGGARRRRHFLSPAQIEDERLRRSGMATAKNDSGSETARSGFREHLRRCMCGEEDRTR